MCERELSCGAEVTRYVGRTRFNQNGVVQPLLTDLYQITMAYAYWKSGKTDDHSVFDLFFRNNPFQGEFTIFAGLEECLKFLENFHYSDSDIEYLKLTLPDSIEDGFYEYLRNLDAKDVTLYALDEGSVAFPRVPLIKIEGPLIIVQLLETTLLTLVNYASLMATNAARYRMVAGKHINLLEFGLRRAQGPDGGLSASKYSYIGGFDGTSNVLAGKLFNIPVRGTHAHAYITSFTGISELKTRMLRHKVTGVQEDLLERAILHRDSLSRVLDISTEESSEGELAAMVSFAIAFPDGFMALVDTYDVKSQISGQHSPKKLIENGHKLLNGTNNKRKGTKRPSGNGKLLNACELNNNDDLRGENSVKENGAHEVNPNLNGKQNEKSAPNKLKESVETLTTATSKYYLSKSVEKSFRYEQSYTEKKYPTLKRFERGDTLEVLCALLNNLKLLKSK